MKDEDVTEMLALMANADQRNTASLVELVAATVLFKAAPPQGDEIAEVSFGQSDIAEAAAGFFYQASYSDDGTMTLRICRNQDKLTEVTSE